MRERGSIAPFLRGAAPPVIPSAMIRRQPVHRRV